MDQEALRKAANDFLFNDEAGDSPLVAKAADIAHALLEWLSPFGESNSYQKLARASRAYEQLRIQ